MSLREKQDRERERDERERRERWAAKYHNPANFGGDEQAVELCKKWAEEDRVRDEAEIKETDVIRRLAKQLREVEGRRWGLR